ncbi:DegQ family serine endoprotease [Elongatibacter sediminis]|uniref:Probable periplasmic serine endoprotease DegP-like n=1 Tax=Elongatibacter sediminis TaxID=3119006 RepID=A0AAW9RA14_9GAMM
MTRPILLTTGTLLCAALLWAAVPVKAAAAVSGLPDFTELVEQAGPAVVNIQVTQFGDRARNRNRNRGDQQAPYDQEDIPEFFRRFFDTPGNPGNPGIGQPDRRGLGSGFIIEDDGYIITNHHVVEDADQIVVRLDDRREFEAELIGSDPQSDVALLKIDAKGLPALAIGDSESLKPGEWVVAIGSPFNFEQSVTAGIVSAKGRSTGAQQYVPFIQTDVAINRGNSGGPLLNLEGEVVGINSWILSSSGGYIGLSFSIPIETAMGAVKQLRETGTVSRGLMGVMIGPVTREIAEAMSLDRSAGALVNDVTPGGSAERAGIQPGDVILEFDGQTIETSGDLPPLVGAHPPGAEVEVLVSREGRKKRFEVTLDALNGDSGGAETGGSGPARQSNALGLAVEAMTAEQRRALGNPDGGVIVSDVESDAAFRAGIRPGDVVLMINSEPVGDLGDFEDIVSGLEPDKAVALRVLRDGVTSFFAYTPSAED